jgi:hypothetical protein
MGGHAQQVGNSSASAGSFVFAVALAIAGSGSRGLAQRWLPRDAPVSTYGGAMYHENGSGALVWIGSQMARAQTWALAGGSWNYRDLAVSPPARQRWATAYDEVRGRAVVFGGSDGTANLNDTWEFDGAVWTQITPALAPSARDGHAMAFDPARARTVLFGGWVGNASLGDTWEYDGVNWVQRSPTNAPGPRHNAAMTYDPTLGACLLVGGLSIQGTGNESIESWTFDGLTWAQLPTTIAPRERHALAFDAQRGRSVAYGGRDPGTGMFLVDTWELAGNQWQAVPTTRTPPGSLAVTCTFDPLRGQVVAFGGSTFSTRGSSALWAFNGTDWTEAVPDRMPLRNGPLLAYDTRRKRIVLHGGYDLANVWAQSTFEWDGGQWSEVVTNTVPPPLYSMTYDPRRGVVVAPAGAQTYEYDGVDWRAVTTTHAVGSGVLGYDSRRERIVLFEPAALRIYDGVDWSTGPGITTPPAADSQLIEHPARAELLMALSGGGVALFDGQQWSAPVGFPLSYRAIAADAQRGAVLSYGPATTPYQDLYVMRDRTLATLPGDGVFFLNGPMTGNPAKGLVYVVDRNGQVYELDWRTTPSFGRLGFGCPGSLGVPHFDAPGPVTPRLGLPLPLTVRSLPAQPGLLGFVAGTRIDTFGPQLLPWSLGAFGLPGCWLWVAPEVSWLLPHPGHRLDFGLPIPNSAALAGQLLAVQPFVFDAAAGNGIGAVGNAVVVIPW